MNNVDSTIVATIAYYTTTKVMREFLHETNFHDKNIIKIVEVEEELF